MKFNPDKVMSCFDSDFKTLNTGDRCFFSDSLHELKYKVEKGGKDTSRLLVLPYDGCKFFQDDNGDLWELAYKYNEEIV